MAKQIEVQRRGPALARTRRQSAGRRGQGDLGPRGRHVVLAKAFGGPTVTNDGVTIAREIDLEDPFENLGAQLVKSVATKTNDVAGDGTTTATVLAQAIVKAGLRNVAAGANPIAARSGHRQGRRCVVRRLIAAATPVRDPRPSHRSPPSPRRTRRSASWSPRRMDRSARTVSSPSRRAPVDHRAGSHRRRAVRQGLPVAVLRHRHRRAQEAVLEDALVLICRGKIARWPICFRCWKRSSQTGKPLLILAEDVEGEPLSTLVVNSIRKTSGAAAVKAPYFGDRRKAFLEDLAVVTGGTVITSDIGITLADAGVICWQCPPDRGDQGFDHHRRRCRHHRGHRQPGRSSFV